MSKSFPEWWKHGQKVRTANDGVLTLNIAEDSEYWLTNNAGKEVSVFSMDILGPASVTEGCSMTDITELPPNIGYGIRRRWHAQRGQRNGRGGRYQRLPSRHNLRKWIAKRLIAEVLAEGRNG
ncbi:hypothetical protein ACXDJA_002563 [Klebsiella variicola]